MTFEFIDPDGDVLRADAVGTQDGGPHVALTIGNWEHGRLTTADVAVDVDRVEEVVAGIRDAARQAAGQTPTTEQRRDCPACDAGIEHTEHCPTPETHNWGCGCPTDKAPAAAARQALASYMGGQGNDPTLGLLLNDYHSAVARETTAALGKPAVEQPAEAQSAEAPLTAAERQFLKFALDLAFDRMVSDDGFTNEDDAALARLRRMTVEDAADVRPADLLAECATEYQVPVPEGDGTTLQVRRQALVHGTGWAVSTRAYGGGRAWTTEGWQESISALSVDRLFCWPDAATAVDEARRALTTAQADEETH